MAQKKRNRADGPERDFDEEAAARKRELYLRATLDNLPFLFWLKDDQSRFLTVNKVFADACGRASPDELVGLSDLDVWPRNLAERYRADDRAVMDSRRELAVEEPVSGGSDSGWIETYKKPVISDDGVVLGTVGFARDITRRKRVEQALVETEMRWHLAVSGANDGIWDWDQASGKVFFSDRWKSMLGYGTDEIGDCIAEWDTRIHPDDRDRVMSLRARHLEGGTDFFDCAHRLRCKDGSYRTVLSRGRAVFDEAGHPMRMAGASTDVTEWRQSEERLRERTEQLDAIFALSPDGFVSFDTKQRVKYVSPAFLNMTGVIEDDLVGIDEQEFSTWLAGLCSPHARFPGVAALRVRSRASPGIGGDASQPRQIIELSRAGKRMLEYAFRESPSGAVPQILYFRDVTHEIEVDQLKSEFLSTAAHELRTPMASIYGFSELMLDQEFSPEERREFVSAIHRQSELMVSIINELLDLARIEARRGKDFKFCREEVTALVSDFLKAFKAPSGRPALQVSLPVEPCWIRADRKKLAQALGNVVSNAYKYSPVDKGVSIVVESVGQGRESMVGLSVRDEGIGMTPASVARVCERFFRADTSGKYPGTGLGMAIVKEIVDLHGGRLAIDSRLGAGTTVALWFPADLPAGEAP